MQHFPAEACTPFRNKQISNPEGKSGIGTLSEIAIWHKNLSTIKSWRNTKTALVQIPAAIVTKKTPERMVISSFNSYHPDVPEQGSSRRNSLLKNYSITQAAP